MAGKVFGVAQQRVGGGLTTRRACSAKASPRIRLSVILATMLFANPIDLRNYELCLLSNILQWPQLVLPRG